MNRLYFLLPIVFAIGTISPFLLAIPIESDASHAPNSTVLYYDSLIEKRSIITVQESLGKQLYHDDFIDQSGRPTDGNSGKLTFGDSIDRTPSNDEIRERELQTKLAARTATVSEISEYLQLRHGF